MDRMIKYRKAAVHIVLIAAFALVFLMQEKSASAYLDDSVELSISHSDDCSCGISGEPDYFIPGSTHKFELGVRGSVTSFDDLTGCKYEWKSGGISESGDTISTLVSSDGKTACYRLEDSGRTDDPIAMVSATLSYTGFTTDGNVVEEAGDGGCSSILHLKDEFWIASANCNPGMTVTYGDSKKLKLYAQHFTLDDPLGGAVDDITSWIDWGKVRTSGCGVKVTSDGILETADGIEGEFRINVAPAVSAPEGVFLDVISDAMTGIVETNDSSAVAADNAVLKLKVQAKKGAKKIVVKTARKASIEVIVEGRKYTISSAKNKNGKVTVKLSKKLSKGQSVKVTVSKSGFANRVKNLKIK